MMTYAIGLFRSLLVVSFLLFLIGWQKELSTPTDSIAPKAVLWVIGAAYIAVAIAAARHKELCLGLTIGVVSGIVAILLTRPGIIFVLIQPSLSRKLYYWSNLGTLACALSTSALFYRRLRLGSLLSATLSSFGCILLLLLLLFPFG